MSICLLTVILEYFVSIVYLGIFYVHIYRLVPAKVVRNWKVMLINGNPLYEEQPVSGNCVHYSVCYVVYPATGAACC